MTEFEGRPLVHAERDTNLPVEVRRDYIIDELTKRYEECVREMRHDEIAWEKLSYWLWHLAKVRDEERELIDFYHLHPNDV